MNRRRLVWLLPAALLAAAIPLVVHSFFASAPPQPQPKLSGLSVAPGSFARADGPRPLSFPADLGPHNDFQTEWWYYTGNLTAADGRQFGFELTFFRHALLGPAEQVERASAWGTSQVYLAHFTLSDIAGQQFHVFERYERGAGGLAGAQGVPQYRVWLQDWSVQQTSDNGYHLFAQQDGIKVDLSFVDQKGPILQGDHGYSQKGPDPGQASYYVSQTRLISQGTVEVGGKPFAVSGTSWMDHEYSTTALAPDQVGWDWFSIQLDDGSEVMMYTFRRADGSIDDFSSGTVIDRNGEPRPLKKADFQVLVNATWKSPHSASVYPAAWTLTIPSEGLTLRVKPLMADQELNVSFVYWEGAAQIEGVKNGVSVKGRGYVELTGYGQSLQGQF